MRPCFPQPQPLPAFMGFLGTLINIGENLNGDSSLEDASRCGRSTDVVSSDIKVLIEEDWSLQVREIADILKIGFGTVQRHLKLLGLTSI
ncbi:unnamed protein product [Nezara viridula]|uniref:Uncharacterized protein n=1 Tax=Nezara viridula TaxID=85310 RepID=A0A9P0HKW6_NEZVI|nr:unnamed protein product [Nezara viridula]